MSHPEHELNPYTAEQPLPPPEIGQSATAATVELADLDTASAGDTVQSPTVERRSTWNIEVNPEIEEAVGDYFERENTKVSEAGSEASLLTWAEDFRSKGAVVPAESSDPVEQEKRQQVLAKLDVLGCEPESAANELPLKVDRRLNELHGKVRKLYTEATVPITFITEDELATATHLSEKVNGLIHGIKEAHETAGRPLSFLAAELSDVDVEGAAKQAQADVAELVDTDQTTYAHTTNFLDKVIQNGYVSPRTEDRSANTGTHSTGVHFSRDMYDAPRFGFDGPGLDAYMREQGITHEDLLRGDIIFPLGEIIKSAPIRAESSTPKYNYESTWGQERTGPLNIDDPEAIEYVKPESLQKVVDETTGATRKQAGDTVFFAAEEDSGRAYDYQFPINGAYMVVENEADGRRASALLSDAGHSTEWIAEHLIVDARGNGIEEIRQRLSQKPARLIAPLASRRPPNEYRDYTADQQFNTQSELTMLSASTIDEL